MVKERIVAYVENIVNEFMYQVSTLNGSAETTKPNKQLAIIKVQLKEICILLAVIEETTFKCLDDTEFDALISPTENIFYLPQLCYVRNKALQFDDFTLTSLFACEYMNYLTGYYSAATTYVPHTEKQKSIQLLYLHLLGIVKNKLPYGNKKRAKIVQIYNELYGECPIKFPEKNRAKAKLLLRYLIENGRADVGICTENVQEINLEISTFINLTQGTGLETLVDYKTLYYSVSEEKILREKNLSYKEYCEEVKIIRELNLN